MQLDGSFLGTQLSGDLLVQHSLHNQPENLTLARCEFCQPSLDPGSYASSATRFRALDQGRCHCAQELTFVERLEQKIRRPRLHAENTALDVGESSHQHNGERAPSLVYRALDVEPGEAWHSYVEDQTTRHVWIGTRQKSGRG